MIRRDVVLAIFLTLAGAGGAAADPLSASQLIACRPNRPDVTAVSIAGLRFGFESNYAWANARILLTMRNGTAREYLLAGRADPTDKSARPNNITAGFAYPGFTCMVQYPSIVSVHNCTSADVRRSCEIGLAIFGVPTVFAVSMTAEKAPALEASAP